MFPGHLCYGGPSNHSHMSRLRPKLLPAFVQRAHTRSCFLVEISCTISQAALRHAWLNAPANRLCAWEVAKALGLRAASREIHGGNGRLSWIAARLKKVGGGCPSVQSLHELFAKIDADAEWFPGKDTGKKRGPKVLLTEAKRRCIARSAMAAKEARGNEPSVSAVIKTCPAATLKPNTGKPFSRRHIRKVFLQD